MNRLKSWQWFILATPLISIIAFFAIATGKMPILQSNSPSQQPTGNIPMPQSISQPTNFNIGGTINF